MPRVGRVLPRVWAALAGLVLASAAGLWMVFFTGAYTGVSTGGYGQVPADGHVVQHDLPSVTTHSSLIAVNGVWVVLVALAIPIALAALGLLAAVKGYSALLWTAAIALLGYSFIAGLSIGLLFVPAAVACFVSALTQRRARATS
jgi:hypothetical protein